jgi:hypothetical protein
LERFVRKLNVFEASGWDTASVVLVPFLICAFFSVFLPGLIPMTNFSIHNISLLVFNGYQIWKNGYGYEIWMTSTLRFSVFFQKKLLSN